MSADELLPTPLRLRKEIEQLTETVQDLRSEQEVREVAQANSAVPDKPSPRPRWWHRLSLRRRVPPSVSQ